MLAQYAVYQAEKSESLAILLSCRLYTKPLYVLKQLRNIWEREVQDGSTHMFNTNTNKDDDQHVPLEFLTMRRRPARRASSARSSKSENPKIYNFDLQSDQQHQPMSSILADLKEATDQLAAGIKNV